MRYGVIGAGALGLTAALRLAQRGQQVTVLEQGSAPGGLAAGFDVAPGISLERFYHHIFRSDTAAIALIRELGLGDRLEWHRPVSTVLVDGVPRQLDSPGSLLRFRDLSLGSRLRVAATLGVLKILPSARPLESSTADAWMRRTSGREAHEVVWRPLLEGKFGDHYQDVSMAWLWARLHDRTTELGYLRHGFQQLYDALAAAIVEVGGEIRPNASVSAIETGDPELRLRWTESGGRELVEPFDRVVSTLPPHVTDRLAGRSSEPPAGFPPLSAHCLVLALDRPVTGIYWIGVPASTSPFLAVVEHTAMARSEDYGGRTMLYLGAYRPPSDERLRLPLEAQVDLAQGVLHGLNPSFERSWLTNAWSFTAPNAQPIVDPGYRARIQPIATSVRGLYCASMFHVYPHDRGQNYSIALAERLVRHLERRRS